MSVLTGRWIKERKILEPFEERTQFKGLSFGVGPAGYDVRVEFDKEGFWPEKKLYPGEFTLASTVERFVMPPDVIGIVHDKSTWARMGLAVQNTVIEPGWEGWLTLELTNHSRDTITIPRGVGIAQVLFHLTVEAVEKSYDGKYHHQERGPVPAKTNLY